MGEMFAGYLCATQVGSRIIHDGQTWKLSVVQHNAKWPTVRLVLIRDPNGDGRRISKAYDVDPRCVVQVEDAPPLARQAFPPGWISDAKRRRGVVADGNGRVQGATSADSVTSEQGSNRPPSLRVHPPTPHRPPAIEGIPTKPESPPWKRGPINAATVEAP